MTFSHIFDIALACLLLFSFIVVFPVFVLSKSVMTFSMVLFIAVCEIITLLDLFLTGRPLIRRFLDYIGITALGRILIAVFVIGLGIFGYIYSLKPHPRKLKNKSQIK